MIEPYQKAFAQLGVQDAARAAAMRDLELPGSRNEAWRFTKVRSLLGDAPAPVTGTLGRLPAGVVSLVGHASVGSIAGAEGLLGLNLGLWREGALVQVDGSFSGTIPVHTTEGLGTPRILVLAGPGAQIELFVDHAVDGGVSIPVIELAVGAGARVTLTQRVVGKGSFAGHVAIDAGPDSHVEVQTILAGGGTLRAELTAVVRERARLECAGLVLGRDRQHADQHLEIHHHGEGATSSQVFRNIVDDHARAIFTGQVTVEKDVRGTDAVQSANSLLLADGASAVARPWLEIHNEHVTAAHGATVGRLDPESLFYLRTRGLDEAGARRLLTRAFAGQVVSAVPEAFREGIQAGVNAWLGE